MVSPIGCPDRRVDFCQVCVVKASLDLLYTNCQLQGFAGAFLLYRV